MSWPCKCGIKINPKNFIIFYVIVHSAFLFHFSFIHWNYIKYSLIWHIEFVYCVIAKFTYYFYSFFPIHVIEFLNIYLYNLFIKIYYLFPICMLLFFFLYWSDENLHYNFLYMWWQLIYYILYDLTEKYCIIQMFRCPDVLNQTSLLRVFLKTWMYFEFWLMLFLHLFWICWDGYIFFIFSLVIE